MRMQSFALVQDVPICPKPVLVAMNILPSLGISLWWDLGIKDGPAICSRSSLLNTFFSCQILPRLCFLKRDPLIQTHIVGMDSRGLSWSREQCFLLHALAPLPSPSPKDQKEKKIKNPWNNNSEPNPQSVCSFVNYKSVE